MVFLSIAGKRSHFVFVSSDDNSFPQRIVSSIISSFLMRVFSTEIFSLSKRV